MALVRKEKFQTDWMVSSISAFHSGSSQEIHINEKWLEDLIPGFGEGGTHINKYATLYVPITMRQRLSDAESINRVGKEDQSSVDDDKYLHLKPFPDAAQKYLGAEPPICTIQE